MRDGKKAASWAILGLAAVMVAAALWVAGGPLTARAQNRDFVRMSDLRSLWWHANCQGVANGNNLPETPSAQAGCGELPRMADPATGEAYRYERLGPQSLRLCAKLELPTERQRDAAKPAVAVEGQPGCFDFAMNIPAPPPSAAEEQSVPADPGPAVE